MKTSAAVVNGAQIARSSKIDPFVKWVGGKRQLLNDILPMVPFSFKNYYEPFVGGGAVFFSLADRIRHATLSDNNLELVVTYRAIQKQPEDVIELLRTHLEGHRSDALRYYYQVRSQRPTSAVSIAARLIYLNKTCYNGLFRVNRAGGFNVPIGRHKAPNIVSENGLWACYRALKRARIVYGDFTTIDPEDGDFVYCDPPYHPTDESSFTKYTKDSFTEHDQVRLKEFAERISKRNVRVLLSNSNTKFIRQIYGSKPFRFTVVSAPRSVNCKPAGRGHVEELLIRNYP